jgi:hypothetical protein
LKEHLYLLRKPSVLEAGACSTLIPCENCVTFRKEYFLPLVFQMEIGSVCYK